MSFKKKKKITSNLNKYNKRISSQRDRELEKSFLYVKETRVALVEEKEKSEKLVSF